MIRTTCPGASIRLLAGQIRIGTTRYSLNLIDQFRYLAEAFNFLHDSMLGDLEILGDVLSRVHVLRILVPKASIMSGMHSKGDGAHHIGLEQIAHMEPLVGLD